MRLAITVVIVLVIVVLVLSVMAAFFMSGAGTGIGTTKARSDFEEGCLTICQNGFVSIDELQDFDVLQERFVNACRQLYPLKAEYSIACLNFCSNQCKIVTDPCQAGCLLAKSSASPSARCNELVNAIPQVEKNTILGFVGTCGTLKDVDTSTGCRNLLRTC